ncbi:MAG: LysM peptidoglycan-binding domain-containing protein [Verrucomicrobiales bacterium]|jgi:LysM repeat protein|nr:LysM peptidoglycan-binding domain-containing protein [Verrucomicrobiales bacterium]
MIKQSLGLTACLGLIVACGGDKYSHSEIPARTGIAQPAPSSADVEPPPPGVASSNSKPVIYDYPGGTRPISPAPLGLTPAPAPPVSGPGSPAAGRARSYTVQAGDTLWRVAHQHNVTVSNLKLANGLTGDTIHIGQVLRIP